MWPVSREAHPKPFIKLPDGESHLLKTLNALATGAEPILTVTNCDYYFITRDEYFGLEMTCSVELDYMLEPAGRNTAPAIVAVAFRMRESYGERAVMLGLAADHLIQDTRKFFLAVPVANTLAEAGHLVTFGIRPIFPETGFGYIEAGDSIESDG